MGDAQSDFFCCRDRGVLAQFRHQHFMLFLIAHFQKASLLMFSAQLVEALQRLHIHDVQSVKRFKRAIRASFERFLRFTHRYWFHEISEQAHVRALSHLSARHLDTDTLYAEVKERIADMNTYLEADSLRRQANTVVRLTVVTLFGLIGTITTGFLGMNLLAEADAPLWRKLVWFVVVGLFTSWLTFYTLIKSQRLSDFIDALSDKLDVQISHDGGRTFKAQAAPATARALDIAVNPGDPQQWAVGTEQGTFISANAGGSWRQRDTTSGARVAWVRPDALYSAGLDGKIRLSSDGGRSWREVGTVGAGPKDFTAGPDGNLYAYVPGGKIRRSPDGGRTWADLTELL